MRETRRCASASGTVIALLCAAGSATAGTRLETLRFVDSNPPPSPVVGFRLYVGAVGKPVTPINLGMPPPGTDGIRSFPLLVASGASVQLRLTAYDAIGRESDPSNRILRAPRGPTFDHDADGASDLVRIDSASGLVEILSAGSSGVSAQALSLGAPPQSSIVARGDFDGSGTSDLLWQRHGSRDLTLWRLGATAGSSLAGGVDPVALPKPGPGLRLLGSGDLDGDARDDLVFRDVASGDLDLWFLDGATLRQEELIPGPSKPWRLVGIGDVDADRRSDFVWWNPSTEAFRIWHMNGATVLEDLQPPGLLPHGSKPMGLGDYDGDGTSDLVARLGFPIWIAFSSLRDGLGPPSVIAVAHPQVGAATGHDFDGDGNADLLLVSPSARTVNVLPLGPSAGSPMPLDFSAASLPGDVAREIGDADGDWNPDWCDADFDNNGVVGQSDFLLVARCIGDPAAEGCDAADINGDGVVGLPELLLVGSEFGGVACEALGAP